eukprot:5021477-Amphidinium_carterae.1
MDKPELHSKIEHHTSSEQQCIEASRTADDVAFENALVPNTCKRDCCWHEPRSIFDVISLSSHLSRRRRREWRKSVSV